MSNPRSRLLEAVTKPLGFFVLALLIVEAFLATVLVGSTLSPDQKYTGMWVGVGMFVFVVLLVVLLVWFRPRHLMYDQYGHLAESGYPYFGDQSEIHSLDDLIEQGQTATVEDF